MRLRFIPLLALLFPACETLFMPEDPPADPRAVFEQMWTALDTGYALFPVKGIDWDSVRDAYDARVTPDLDREALFAVLGRMGNELRDGHVNLRSENDVSKYLAYYQDHPINYNPLFVEQHYLGNEYHITPPFLHAVIDSVGYLRYGSFNAPFSVADLEDILARFAGLKGLVIDLRNNEGGDPQNGYRILERLADERRHLLSNRWKNGPGHDDLGPVFEVWLEPAGAARFDGPVAVLTNRVCYSATSYFAAACKAYPHITQIGDWTGGGAGVPHGVELANGFSLNFSASSGTYPDGRSFEAGVPPDIRVDWTEADRAEGKDTILERALTELGAR